MPICAANLTRGDQIPTAELILNGVVIREYFDGLRQTSYAQWNFSDDWGDIYFDHSTGVIVELSRTHAFVNEITGEVVEKTNIIKLLDTNRWQISGT